MTAFADERFRRQQRVKPSPEGLQAHLGLRPDDRGTVVGFGRASRLVVWVRKDHRKTRVRYHHRFWEAAGTR